MKELEGRDEGLWGGSGKGEGMVKEIEEMVGKKCRGVDIGYSGGDVWGLKKGGKKGVMVGIEKGYGIGKDMRNVEGLGDGGVV